MKITRLFTINNVVAKLTCPNKHWKVGDDDNCHPIESSYALNCLASHFELHLAQGLFNMNGKVRVGKCMKTIEYDDDDYAVITMRYDERSNESGHLCHSGINGQHRLRNQNGTFTQLVYDIASPLILDRRSIFSIYCAIPDTVNLTNRHRTNISSQQNANTRLGVVVDEAELGTLFTLNKYAIDWSHTNNEQAAMVGAVTNFRVDSTLSTAFDYRLDTCRISGLSDDGAPMEYTVKYSSCLSTPLAALQTNSKSLTFNMAAFGTQADALESLFVTCSVRICVDHCEKSIFAQSDDCAIGYTRQLPGLFLLPYAPMSTTTSASTMHVRTSSARSEKTSPTKPATTSTSAAPVITTTTTSKPTRTVTPLTTQITSVPSTTIPLENQESRAAKLSRIERCRNRVRANKKLRRQALARQLKRCTKLTN